MLTDDAGDPGLRTTEMLAAAAIREGWTGRVTACHARAMGLYPEPYFRRLLADAYYAFGQHNLLEVVFLAAHILSRATTHDLEVLLDMITVQAARVLRITDYCLEVGRAAHLVVLEGSTVLDVIAHYRPPRYVISHGRLVAQTTGTTTFHAIPTP